MEAGLDAVLGARQPGATWSTIGPALSMATPIGPGAIFGRILTGHAAMSGPAGCRQYFRPVSQSRRGFDEGADRPAEPSRRAGDAERDATVARLTEASARGELGPTEFDERLGAALRATYVEELEPLTADLSASSPGPGDDASTATSPRRPFWCRAGFQYHAIPYVMVNGMLVGIWALTGHGFFWPFFPIAGWGIGLGMHGLVAGSLPGRRHRLRHLPRGTGEADFPPSPLAGPVPLPVPPWLGPPAAHRPGPGQATTPGGAPEEPSTVHVAVLFADIVDSTGLNERLGDTTWNALRTRYLGMMRECVANHQGIEVSTQGDGLFARFDLPVSAVAAAIAMQKRIDAEQASSPSNPPMRVGIHAGQVIEDGDDLIGNMVNLAFRLSADAQGGQILVTESVADLAGDAFSFDDCGLRQLRGLSRPRHVLAVRR